MLLSPACTFGSCLQHLGMPSHMHQRQDIAAPYSQYAITREPIVPAPSTLLDFSGHNNHGVTNASNPGVQLQVSVQCHKLF